MKHLYIVYQYLIAFPLLVILTLFTAIFTIILAPWKNSRLVHAEQMFWARSFFWLLFLPVKVTGTENIQKGQSYVFVSNHQSALDVWAIYGYLPVVYKWLMKAEIRKIPFVGLACKCAGHIFVERGNARASFRSLKAIEEQLTNGVCTVIFPEGTRSKDGKVERFKRGAFQIALDLHLPVIPISLSGCYEAFNRKAKYVTRHPIGMHIGTPIDLAQYTEPEEAIAAVRDAVVAGQEQQANIHKS